MVFSVYTNLTGNALEVGILKVVIQQGHNDDYSALEINKVCFQQLEMKI